jgi:hypothetical protein
VRHGGKDLGCRDQGVDELALRRILQRQIEKDDGLGGRDRAERRRRGAEQLGPVDARRLGERAVEAVQQIGEVRAGQGQ